MAADGEVEHHAVGQVDEPQSGQHLPKPDQPRAARKHAEARRDLGQVDQGQPDEHEHHRNIAGGVKNQYAEDGEQRESDRHPALGPRVAAVIAPVRDREPMRAECREGEGGHVERCRVAEHVEPGQPDDQVDAGDQLHEPGHPGAPHGDRLLDRRAARWELEQRLAAGNEVAGRETEKPDGDRPELR